MDDSWQILRNKSVNIDVNNIPANMKYQELNEFCSLFGTVKSITWSVMNKSHATVQYNDQSFYDPVSIEEASDVTSDLPDVFARLKTENLWRNETFLSDLMKILVSETENQEQKDENQNIVDSAESSSSYLICTYCYSLADFLCERCRFPYCSTKCQSLDWLKHKKSCAKVDYNSRRKFITLG